MINERKFSLPPIHQRDINREGMNTQTLKIINLQNTKLVHKKKKVS